MRKNQLFINLDLYFLQNQTKMVELLPKFLPANQLKIQATATFFEKTRL